MGHIAALYQTQSLSVVCLSQQPRADSNGNWFLLSVCLQNVCKRAHQQLPLFLGTHDASQEIVSSSLPLNLGLALWLTLTHRIWQLWCCVTPRPIEKLQFHPLDNQPPGKRGLSWTARWQEEMGWRRKAQQLKAITRTRRRSGAILDSWADTGTLRGWALLRSSPS